MLQLILTPIIKYIHENILNDMKYKEVTMKYMKPFNNIYLLKYVYIL